MLHKEQILSLKSYPPTLAHIKKQDKNEDDKVASPEGEPKFALFLFLRKKSYCCPSLEMDHCFYFNTSLLFALDNDPISRLEMPNFQ